MPECAVYILKLKSALSLTNLSVGTDLGFAGRLTDTLEALHCCFNQIETLQLQDLRVQGLRGYRWIPNFPRLKKLIILISADNFDDFVYLLPLIEAAASLLEFIMMLDCHPTPRWRLMHSISSPPHQCLKWLKL